MSQNTPLSNALMSDATYKNLNGNNDLNAGTLDFSVSLTNDFIEKFSFIDQSLQNNYSSGFQGTVFQNKTSGVYTIAFAGTDITSDVDIINDYLISSEGMAIHQFIDAYNYYQQVTHTSGAIISQISGPLLTKPAEGNFVAQTSTVHQSNGVTTTQEVYYLLEEVVNTGANAGKIPAGATIEFTGHSLGGHLAGLMSMVTGNEAIIFNAPGYKTGTIINLNSQIESAVDCLIVDLLGKQINQSNVTHYENKNGISIISNYGIDWNNTIGVNCFEKEHRIYALSSSLLAQNILNDLVNEECFIENSSNLDSCYAVQCAYNAYCIANNLTEQKIDFSNYKNLQELLYSIKIWAVSCLNKNIDIQIDVNKKELKTFSGSSKSDFIFSGKSNNKIETGAGDDFVISGYDQILKNARMTQIVDLGSGNDVFIGGNESDLVDGGDGNDTIKSGSGHDHLTGGQGNDILEGGAGNDWYYFNPGDGRDIIQGDKSGSNTIRIYDVKENYTLYYRGSDYIIYRNNLESITIKQSRISKVIFNPSADNDNDDVVDFDEWAKNAKKWPINDTKYPRDGFNCTSDRNKYYSVWFIKSPLAVDLDGDGVETVNVTAGETFFDHDGNGFAEQTAWIKGDDGLLVRDINGNGQIDDGSELFGDQTVLSNGKKAANGFEALADLDSNQDGVFDGDDDAFGEVMVWQDINEDGKVDRDELMSLEQAGITSIDLNYQNQSVTDINGNEHLQTSAFTKIDGTTGTITDVWLKTDLMNTTDQVQIEIPAEIAVLPNIQTIGNVHSLHTAMALDTTGALKTLVEQYAAETDPVARDTILLNLIYTWVGVIDVDPESRAASKIYGNVIGDARKLETLEQIFGEKYLGTWCDGERDPNPHGPAAKELLVIFENIKNQTDAILLSQTHLKDFCDAIQIISAESGESSINLTEAIEVLEEIFNSISNTDQPYLMKEIFYITALYDDYETDLLTALKSAGDLNGTDFDVALATLGEKNVGTSGNDILSGTEENDTLYGLAGNDTLMGQDGNDTLNGGAGNDHLIGGNGSDTYIFSAGFGHDTIDNTHTDDSSDTILFSEELSPENAVVSREGYDLIISFGENDSLRIYSYFDERGQSSAVVDTIKFSDTAETTWHFSDIAAITGVADGSDNFFIGTNGTDIYDGLGGDDMIYGGDGDDVLSGGNGDDVIFGDSGNDTLDGGAGDDTLYGGTGSDSYKFGRGSGKDTVIETDKNEGDVDQILLGEGVTANDIFVSRDDKNLYVSIYGTDEDPTIYDVLTIKDYYAGDDAKVSRLVFADGTVWNDLNEHVTINTGSNEGQTIYGSGLDDTIVGTDGNDVIKGDSGDDVITGGLGDDTLYGGSGDDILDGGAGNDTLRGGPGSDVYKFGFGYNNDVIDEDSFDNDVIQLAEGITAGDVSFGRTASAIYIELSDHSRLTIKNFVTNTTNNGIILRYADGSTVNLKQKLSELPVTGTIFNDNLQGDGANNTLIGRAGDDILSGYAGNDHLDGGAGDDMLYGGEGNDTYHFGFGYGNDVLEDNLGTNTIELNDDVTADDVSFRRDMYDLTLILSDGSTLLIKNGGHTSDTAYHISEITFANGSDNAINVETLLPTLPIYGTDNAETINGSDAGETVYAGGGHDTVNGNNGADILYGGAGDDTLYGGDGNDILDGGAGNDTLNGGYGNDVYRLMLNGGKDIIIDNFGANIIEVDENVSADEVQIVRSLTSVKIVLPDGSSFTMTKGASESEDVYHLETIRFLNGVDSDINFINRLAMEPLHGTLNDETLSGAAGNDTLYGEAGHDVLNGNNGNDTLYGGTGNDTLNGGNGNDILYGGAGNDTLNGDDGDDILDGGADDDNLYGGYGNDTYLFGFGDGHDRIEDNAGDNIIELKEDVSAEDVTFERIGNDFQIRLSDGSTLLVYHGGSGYDSSYHIKTIKFANGVDADIDVAALLPTLSVQGTADNDSLHGVGGNDLIYGNDGNDTLNGNNGDDTLYGGAGNDTLNGGNGDDTLHGGEGNDILNGDDGDDTLDGGADDDNLYGGFGNDTYLFGFGDGHDRIEDNSGENAIKLKEDVTLSDVVFERVGNDFQVRLSDGSTLLVYRGGDGSLTPYHIKTIKFANGVDADIDVETLLPALTVQGSEESESLYGVAGNDLMHGNGGDDALYGNDGNDTLYGDAGNDTLNGGNGDDTLYGGNGDDTLYGGEGDDTLDGGAGDDTLNGGYGNDILDGGAGDDHLYGGDGNDTYLFGFGDGHDYIEDNQGTNVIKLKEDVTAEDVTFSREVNDFIITLSDGSTLRIKNGGNGYQTQYQFSKIVFANGNDADINMADLLPAVPVYGTDGNDNAIEGTAGGNTIYAGGGDDVVWGRLDNDVLYGEGGNDTLNGNDGNDTLYGGIGDDTLDGGNGNDTLYGGDGNDTLNGGYGDDILDGGADDDNLYGGAGDDTYLFGFGDGHDYIEDNQGTNVIKLKENVTAEDVTFSREVNDFIITLSDGSTLRIKNGGNGYQTQYQFSKIVFANGNDADINMADLLPAVPVYGTDGNDNVIEGTAGGNTIYAGGGDDVVWGRLDNDVLYGEGGNDTLNGNDGNDTLYGGAGNDTLNGGYGDDILDGGAGDDNLYGNDGDDTYLFGFGSGHDYIEDNQGTNVIKLKENVTAEDVTFSREVNDFIITLSDGSTLRIKNGGNGYQTQYQFSKIVFANGNDADINMADLLPTIPVYGTDGNDNVIEGTAGGNIIYAGGGDDVVWGRLDNDVLYGEGGNDTLNGNDGNDTLDGGAGDDNLYGGDGNDTYLFGFGDGHDYIEDDSGENIIKLKESVSLSDVTFERIGNDFQIRLSDGSALLVKNGGNGNAVSSHISTIKFANGTDSDIDVETLLPALSVQGREENESLYGTIGSETISGNGGNDTIYGGNGDDVLNGGTGDDNLYGGSGNDTYIFGSGYGHDYINDNNGINVIQFNADVSAADLSYHKIENNLKIQLPDGSSLTVYNGCAADTAYHIATLKFSNGTDADIDVETLLAQIMADSLLKDQTLTGTDEADTIHGNDGNDVISGLAGNDTLYGDDGWDTLNGGEGDDILYGGNGYDVLYGNAGNDILDGGADDDVLYGGEGNDTYLFGFGDGHDRIEDDQGANVIELKAPVTAADISFKRNISDLTLILSDGSTLFIKDGANIQNITNHISTIKFANGTDSDIDVAALLPTLILEGTESNETFNGLSSADTIYGNGGDDILYGNDGNDTLYGGAGNDILNGGYGDDILDGGAGDDILYGNDGDDTYLFGFGGGNDYIEDNSGENIIKLKENVSLSDVTFERIGNDFQVRLSDGSTLLVKNGGNGNAVSYHISTIKFANGTDSDIDVETLLPDLTVQGSEGTDSLEGTSGSEIIHGNGGNDTLYGNDGNDTLYGDAGNDTLHGGNGNDTLYGGDGNDTLNGGYGNDILDGGAGDDILYGNDGDDTYLFGFGSGHDYVEDNQGTNVIKLKEDVTAEDVTFSREVNDFIITLSDGSSLRIKNGGNGYQTQYQFSKIVFANGIDADINMADLLPAVPVYGTDGNDNAIEGTAGGNTIYAGGGDDVVWGRLDNDVLYGEGGNDTLNGNDGNDTLYGGIGDDTLDGGNGNDTLYGGEGNDTLNGGYGNDTLYGGADDDNLYGGDGNDTYLFGFGDGHDYIEDNQGANVIKLKENVSLSDVTFERIGNDFQVRLSDGSTLLVKNGGSGYYLSSHISTIKFANGVDADIDVETLLPALTVQGSEENDSLEGTSGSEIIHGNGGNDTLYGNDGNDVLYGDTGNDTLHGGNGNDTLYGGAGDDILYGNDGDDTYLFGFGDGHDYIEDSQGANVIKLKEDVSLSDVVFERVGNDFQVRLSDGSTLLVKNGGNGNAVSYHISTIKFANGTDSDIDVETLLPSITVQGSEGTDSLEGTNGSEIIHGNGGNDTLYGNDGNDVLYGDTGNDTLHGGNGNDTLYGGDGNDTIYGDSGNDILDGGAGDDILYGNDGDDTYLFGFGSGNDYIEDNQGTNIIKLKEDVSLSDVAFERIGNDFRICLSDGSTLLVRHGASGNTVSYHLSAIKFANGVDTDINIEDLLPSLVIQGGDGNDTLIGETWDNILDGGAGDDVLKGEGGNDTYLFGFGDGNDVINDTAGENVIKMKSDVTAADLSFARKMNDLVIALTDGSSITLNVDSFIHLPKIIFANGTDADILLADILPTLDARGSVYDDTLFGTSLNDTIYGGGGHDTLHGGDGNDILYGETENDTLNGGNGNDILDGGAGNDALHGGAGDDTYIFGRGYDQDTISDTQGENTLHITQADYDNLWFEREGNDLKVSILGTEDTVTVNSWYSNEDARLVQIQTDTKTIGTADIELLVQAMSSFSQPNTGAISQDSSLSGGFKETVSKLWQART